MTPFALNILIIVGAFIAGYFIGKERRIMRYMDEIQNLRAEKKYWVDIAARQKVQDFKIKQPGDSDGI
jgi:hypothetical protein